MPLLVYTSSDFPFQPFTKIYSADINQCYNDIKTLLNTTGLDDANIQAAGITRSTKLKAGTANYVVINNGSGQMSEEATLAASRGGLGFTPTLSLANAGKSVVVDPTGTTLQLGTPNIDRITQSFTSDIATLTCGEVININDAVALDVANGSGSNQYKVFQANSTKFNRKASFIGFAVNAGTVTPQILTWTNSAALVTSNVISYSINGRTYSTTFATSNDATMTALAAQIATDQDVASATTIAGGGNDRLITITSYGSLQLNIPSPVVTGGASQATVVIAQTQAPSGTTIQIRSFGIMTGLSGLTVGALYYVASTAGLITASPADSNPQLVGQALSSSVLFLSKPNFIFSSGAYFFRTHGSSAGPANGATAVGDGEQFNNTSWSSIPADTVQKLQGAIGENSFNGKIFFIDGQNTSSALSLSFSLYNKASWTAGTTRTTARALSGVTVLNNTLYVGEGLTTVGTNPLDSYNGSSWVNGVTTLNAVYAPACFTQGGKARWIGGHADTVHDTYNGSSVSSDTASTSNSDNGASMSSASGNAGMQGPSSTGSSSQSTYRWNGSSFSSNIAPSYNFTALGTNSATSIASGYNASVLLGFINGGDSSSSASINNTAAFNDTSWSNTTGSTNSRSNCSGGVI